MAVITLSVPSLIMLKKAIKPKLLVLFIGICTAKLLLAAKMRHCRNRILDKLICQRRYVHFSTPFPLNDQGKGKTAVIERSKAAADIVVELLQAGHNDSVAAHPRNNFRQRMAIVGKSL